MINKMQKWLIIGIIAVIIVVTAGYLIYNQESSSDQFTNPTKTPHYETNTPAHASTLAGVPINVVIDFNFDLGPGSTISITKDGTEYGIGETIIDPNRLSMRREMNQDAPDGIYTVNYKACWPDGSCHNGNFQFAIDRSAAQNFVNLTGRQEVTINMEQIAFNPQNVIISKGTRVTWINKDDTEHFINTDAHPSHTYYPAQNSRGLNMSDSFSLTFDKAGIYPYHCSAHAATMTGTILVV